MTTAAWLLLALAAAGAVVDWVAVGRGDRRLEYVAKPATTLAFVGVALTIDPVHADTRAWFVVALVWCLAGDVFLMLPVDAFVPGLASFLVGQLCFAAGFTRHGGDATALVVGAVVAAALALPLAARFVRALRRSGRAELAGPVLAYMVAISAMVATALATANVWAVVGALAFLTSDSLIAESRFVRVRPGVPVAIMVTYHLALAGLVLSLV